MKSFLALLHFFWWRTIPGNVGLCHVIDSKLTNHTAGSESFKKYHGVKMVVCLIRS